VIALHIESGWIKTMAFRFFQAKNDNRRMLIQRMKVDLDFQRDYLCGQYWKPKMIF